MNFITEIKNYTPKCIQEEADKKIFLDCINLFPNVLTRESNLAHFTSSSFIVNKTHDKVLFIYHNIYKSWGWVGGHADGDDDFLYVAKKETTEETGLPINKIKLISNGIATIDSLSVLSHMRKGEYVNAHIHLNTTYLFETDENIAIRKLPDENSDIAWIPINEIANYCTEPHMLNPYLKCVKLLESMK